MATAPLTLEELEQLTDPVERARAVGAYLNELDELGKKARSLRHAAIAEVFTTDPHRRSRPKELADEVGVSVSLVKNVRDGRT